MKIFLVTALLACMPCALGESAVDFKPDDVFLGAYQCERQDKGEEDVFFVDLIWVIKISDYFYLDSRNISKSQLIAINEAGEKRPLTVVFKNNSIAFPYSDQKRLEDFTTRSNLPKGTWKIQGDLIVEINSKVQSSSETIDIDQGKGVITIGDHQVLWSIETTKDANAGLIWSLTYPADLKIKDVDLKVDGKLQYKALLNETKDCSTKMRWQSFWPKSSKINLTFRTCSECEEVKVPIQETIAIGIKKEEGM